MAAPAAEPATPEELTLSAPRRVWAGRVVEVGLPSLRGLDTNAEVAWRLERRGREVAAGGVAVAALAAQQLAITMPEVRARLPLHLTVAWRREEAVTAQAARTIDVFPRDLLARSLARFAEKSVGLVVADAVEREIWLRCPGRWRPMTTGLEVSAFRGEALIVAARAELPERSDLAGALLRRVADGMPLICIGAWPFARTLPIEAGLGAGAGTVVRLAPGHVLLDGLGPGDLLDWPGDGVIADWRVVWSGRGNVVPVLAPGGGAPGDCAALELRYGDGRMLYAGLEPAGRLDDEPAAALLLANLVRWGLTPGRACRPAQLILAAESPLEAVLEDVGVEPADAGILLADRTFFEVKHAARRAQLLGGGGTLVVFGLDEAALGELNNELRQRWEADAHGVPPELRLEPIASRAAGGEPPETSHALLAGIWPADLETMGTWQPEARVWGVRAVGDAEHFTQLIDGGGIGKFERDGVRILFWQLPLRERGDAAQRRVLATFLTHVGVRLQAAPNR